MHYDEAALQQVRETRLLINKCDEWLFETIDAYIGQRILELGCGLGNLVEHLQGRELVVGVDVDQGSVDYVNSVYGELGNIHAYQYDASDPGIVDLKHFKFDTIISLNVFEHIERDVQALKHARELLVPGGRLVLIVPAHMFLYGTMDSSIGHYRRYDLKGLQEKLSNVGLDIVQQKYVNPLGALGWFVNGRVLHKKVPPVGQLKLFNRVMPLVVTAEKILRVPFGLSVLSISTRVD